MRGKYRPHHILEVVLLVICLAVFPAKNLHANEDSKYLKAVREFADNVLKYGRDTYGPKHTPLFVDGLNIHTHEPVKWIAPNGNRWILSNLASQQNLFRTLDGLTRITGDSKYKQAALDAIKYAFANLRSPNGLLYWGGHAAYDVGADNPCGNSVHENKNFYPHYQLMWEVNPTATRKFIESFWSGHIRDWSNLDMDRHCYRMNQTLEEAWKHEYKGGPVFFKPKQGIPASFITTAGGLIHGAATLTKLSGDGEPLVWAKRLAHRYVETRDLKTGIGTGIYTGEQTKMPALEEMKDLDLNELGVDSFFPTSPTSGNSDVRQRISGYYEVSPGIPFNGILSSWICALLVGEMMGSEGRDFIQWSVEELTAWGKVAYRKSDNSWIPMLRDGTSLEGMVIKKDGPFGPEGTIVVPISVIPMYFWAYALAYRLTENDFMWQMARNIALGNDFGDIGVSSVDLPELEHRINCADPYALLGFLELYGKTQCKPFLVRAKQIGDNILAGRFHKGFFAPSNKHFYARFDSPESLALLHLHTSSISSHFEVPTMWPSKALFEHAYRDKDRRDDNSLVYRLTESPEPPISLQEASARGDLNLIRSLIEEGVEIDSREDGFFKTALHRAAMSGHRDVVEYLLTKGAQIDAWNGFPGGTPIDYAVENGHKEIVELLIVRGASVNAKRGSGDRPLHSAVRADHKDIVELLLANGAEINAKNNEGQTPIDVAFQRNRKDIVELLSSKGAVVSLHTAARHGLLEKIKELIAKGTDVNAKNDDGHTALHIAIQRNRTEIVKLLIANETDLNAKNNEGQTPVDIAIGRNRSEVVKLLISRGADVSLHVAARFGVLAKVKSLIEKGTDINEKDASGKTPLHYAAEHDHKDIVELLIANGAEVNIKDNNGNTPGHFALGKNNRSILELLIAEGADINSIHLSAYQGDLEKVRIFVENGIGVNTTDSFGATPLHYAAVRGHRALVEFLVARGADVNAKDKRNLAPLHVAAAHGHKDVVALLIDNAADINAKGQWGYTPIYYAAWSEVTEVVELLLEKGVDVNTKDKWGETPLHYMAKYDYYRNMAEFLIVKGADVNAKDNQGKTPLQVAKENGHTEIVELLRKHGAKE